MSSTFTTVLDGRSIEGERMRVELEAESDEPNRVEIQVRNGASDILARVYVPLDQLAEAVKCCGIILERG